MHAHTHTHNLNFQKHIFILVHLGRQMLFDLSKAVLHWIAEACFGADQKLHLRYFILFNGTHFGLIGN